MKTIISEEISELSGFGTPLALSGPYQHGPQFLEVKELNDLLVEYRVRIRGQIAGLRTYQATLDKQQKAGGVIRQVYASYEGIFQRRRIADLWMVYRILSADCHEMTTAYLENLQSQLLAIRSYQASYPTKKGQLAAA